MRVVKNVMEYVGDRYAPLLKHIKSIYSYSLNKLELKGYMHIRLNILELNGYMHIRLIYGFKCTLCHQNIFIDRASTRFEINNFLKGQEVTLPCSFRRTVNWKMDM